jgi:TRAP-type C4-dicarboxylate transport system substrate-binding protein
MPNFTHGVENGGTPVGDRTSLERIAKEINERERTAWEAKQRAKRESAKKANGY